MYNAFFQQLNSDGLARMISEAQGSVCYAAPGIHMKPAQALIAQAKRIGPELIMVFLDVDENVIRMGYGDIEAIKALHEAGIRVETIPGLRSGLFVVDGIGFSYTPTALFLEREAKDFESLNAMRLTTEQVSEAMARLSPASKAIATAQADSPERKERILTITSETNPLPVATKTIETISEKLQEAPPIKFDIARQVRVFQPHFQYVELSLTGAAIQNHKLTIPKSIQNIGADAEVSGRLRTTFDLIDKNAKVSSKELDAELNTIRTKLTRSLGKNHGRVVLKAALPILEKRLDELRKKIAEHQVNIEKDLENVLSESRKLIVDYYKPLVKGKIPDELYGIFGSPTEKDIALWLDNELSKAFPAPEDLIKNIKLEVNYKDVTFDTLNRPDFLETIQAAYPERDWSKTFDDFLAAGESK